MTIIVALLAYAGTLAVLAPRLLAGPWLRRSPRLALALWHSSAISVLLATILSTVACFADEGGVAHWIPGLTGHHGLSGLLLAAAPIVVPAVLALRLGVVGRRLSHNHRDGRRRHLELVRLLGRYDDELGATVIPVDVPAAYCVPGTDQIVITAGALAVLDDHELRAVVAHEQAHLTGRHHLLVGWAEILRGAFGALPLFAHLGRATADLVELVADDRTVRRTSAAGLASAIAALSCGPAPAHGLAASGGSVLARVERLLAPPAPLPIVPRIGGIGTAVTLLAVPVLLVLAPATVAAGLVECPHPFS
ncbi:M56 family metallopeptidase [Kribbella sp. HUAS MG21]|uniref:M56 family metallopeptidase n=1 Tax=Kribbella sp. HUAS MG21 TaxID=3160966 RepID=A0AAU7T625_9ACTN